MRKRRYTLDEIDLMREVDMFQQWHGKAQGYDHDKELKNREERIRTYMAGGVDPNELVEKARELAKKEPSSVFWLLRYNHPDVPQETPLFKRLRSR